MLRFGLTDDEAVAGLRALKAVAIADGNFDDRERSLVRAAGEALQMVVDCDALEAATPEDAAEAFASSEHRERLVQAMLIVALIDGEASEAEAEVVGRFAEGLGVDEPRVARFEALAKDHLAHLGGEGGAAPLVGGRRPIDDALEADLDALAELPEGSLGRKLHERVWALGLPERHEDGWPDGSLRHYLCQILGDYDPDPAGEAELVAFVAGFSERDPFAYLFAAALHTHRDGELPFEPAGVLAALHRGTQVTEDLYGETFDWQPYLPMPVAEVRRALNVLPKGASAT